MNNKTHITLASSSLCSGCSACINKCPTSSISMQYNKYGFLHPVITADKCIGCHNCERVCPILNPREEIPDSHLQIFSAFIKDKAILKKSTSGGAFFAFASRIIKEGGVVFGAKFDGYRVLHDYTETLDGLYSFMGSKYVQSYVGNTFIKVQHFLSEGRIVLFSGTPCQIAGLNRFVGKGKRNLITVELLCRGVPSPLVWEKYMDKKMSDLNAEEIKEIRFRTKSKAYKSPVPTYSFVFSYKDNYGNLREFNEDCLSNVFYSYFRNHVFRSSCLRCQFRNTYNSGADITIGDAIINTGIGEHSDESTIVLHTDIAHSLWSKVKQTMCYYPIECKELDSFYKGALHLQKKDRMLKFLKLSNILALKYPLERFRFVWEFSLINHRIVSIINRVFKTTL